MSKKKKAKRKSGKSAPRGRSRILRGGAVAAAAVGILAYFLVIAPRSRKSVPEGVPSYNVLLITLDTTRADHLGCYGNSAARTPNLDGLAREGIVFARAYCPAPLTLPSHVSIMTGLYPAAHGVRNNGHEVPAGIRTLAEILKGRGYATGAFVSAFSVDSRFGIDRGFDVYDDTFLADSPSRPRTRNAAPKRPLPDSPAGWKPADRTSSSAGSITMIPICPTIRRRPIRRNSPVLPTTARSPTWTAMSAPS